MNCGSHVREDIYFSSVYYCPLCISHCIGCYTIQTLWSIDMFTPLQIPPTAVPFFFLCPYCMARPRMNLTVPVLEELSTVQENHITELIGCILTTSLTTNGHSLFTHLSLSSLPLLKMTFSLLILLISFFFPTEWMNSFQTSLGKINTVSVNLSSYTLKVNFHLLLFFLLLKQRMCLFIYQRLVPPFVFQISSSLTHSWSSTLIFSFYLCFTNLFLSARSFLLQHKYALVFLIFLTSHFRSFTTALLFLVPSQQNFYTCCFCLFSHHSLFDFLQLKFFFHHYSLKPFLGASPVDTSVFI